MKNQKEHNLIEELTKDISVSPENQKKITALDSILQNDPNNIEALMHKGFYFFEDEADGKAIQIFKHIIQINPAYIDAYIWLAELYLAHWSQFIKAEPLLKEALKQAPHRADIHHLLAWVYREKGDKQQEFIHLNESIALEPTWLMDRFYLISWLINDKRYNAAQQEIETTRAYINPDFKVPADDMEAYYEDLITGRADATYAQHALARDTQRIQDYLNKYPV